MSNTDTLEVMKQILEQFRLAAICERMDKTPYIDIDKQIDYSLSKLEALIINERTEGYRQG